MRLKLLQTLTMNLDVGGVTWSLVFLTMCAFIGADMAYNGNQISHPDKKNPGMVRKIRPLPAFLLKDGTGLLGAGS